MGWDVKLDTTYWEGWYSHEYSPPHCTWWDTDHWVPGDYFYGIFLRAIGTWAVGYRPDKIKLTFSKTLSGSDQIFIRDADLNIIGMQSYPYYSGTEIILDFDGCGDIYEIWALTRDTTTTCSNIEFLPYKINLLDGKVRIKSDTIDLLDGRAEVGAFAYNAFDAKVAVKNEATALFNGKTEVIGWKADKLDGKAEVTGWAADLVDGKLAVANLSSDLFNGKARICLTPANVFDGKAKLHGIATNILDGKALVEVEGATNYLDGRVAVQGWKADLLDGKIEVRGLFEGDVDLSILNIEALIGARGDTSLLALEIDSLASVGTSCLASYKLSKLQALSYIGAKAEGLLPRLEVDSQGIEWILANGAVKVPGIKILSNAKIEELAQGVVRLGTLRISSNALHGSFVEGLLSLPRLYVLGSSVNGAVCEGAILLPCLSINASGYEFITAIGDIDLGLLDIFAKSRSLTDETCWVLKYND